MCIRDRLTTAVNNFRLGLPLPATVHTMGLARLRRSHLSQWRIQVKASRANDMGMFDCADLLHEFQETNAAPCTRHRRTCC